MGVMVVTPHVRRPPRVVRVECGTDLQRCRFGDH